MNYKYTIIWSNKHTNDELVSWMGTTHNTMEDANQFAAKVAHELWDTMPSLSWMVLKHLYSWRTIYKQEEGPF